MTASLRLYAIAAIAVAATLALVGYLYVSGLKSDLRAAQTENAALRSSLAQHVAAAADLRADIASRELVISARDAHISALRDSATSAIIAIQEVPRDNGSCIDSSLPAGLADPLRRLHGQITADPAASGGGETLSPGHAVRPIPDSWSSGQADSPDPGAVGSHSPASGRGHAGGQGRDTGLGRRAQ